MNRMTIICPYCKNESDHKTGYVNRAKKLGVPIYCSRVCSGLARRTTKQEKVENKRLYDIKYRNDKSDYVKQRAKLYNESPAGRAMQKRNREKFKISHAEYIKTEKYKAYKKQYDQIFVAKQKYGVFWESSIVLNKLDEEIKPFKIENRINNGTSNKSQKRKRLWNSMQKTLNKHYGIPSMV